MMLTPKATILKQQQQQQQLKENPDDQTRLNARHIQVQCNLGTYLLTATHSLLTTTTPKASTACHPMEYEPDALPMKIKEVPIPGGVHHLFSLTSLIDHKLPHYHFAEVRISHATIFPEICGSTFFRPVFTSSSTRLQFRKASQMFKRPKHSCQIGQMRWHLLAFNPLSCCHQPGRHSVP